MIISFADKDTEKLFRGQFVARFAGIQKTATRKLAFLKAAGKLEDLKIPPANRLEALKGDRAGQYSIRINDQYRICFVWHDGDAHHVEIVDYH